MSINQTLSSNYSTTVTINGSCFQGACSFNKSGSRDKTTRIAGPCGYCDTSCIYRAIQCIFTLGVIANAIVVFCVARDRKLRNATFVAIAACAAADMCFLIVELVWSYHAVILTITYNYPSRVRQNKTYLAMKVVSWFTANGHVTLLAVVRYVLLTYPLKAMVYITTRRVLLLSALVWTLASLSSFALGLFDLIIDFPKRASHEFHLVLWTTVYLTPVTTTAVLHLVKIVKIRQITTVSTNEQAKLRVQAMSRMVLLVIFIAAVLPFPFVLDGFMRSFGINIYKSPAIALHIRPISRLLVLLNHSINPVVYAFVSNVFRTSLKRMLGLDRSASNG